MQKKNTRDCKPSEQEFLEYIARNHIRTAGARFLYTCALSIYFGWFVVFFLGQIAMLGPTAMSILGSIGTLLLAIGLILIAASSAIALRQHRDTKEFLKRYENCER